MTTEPVFLEAYEVTMGHEGGYVDDPDDPGGETYRGISRVYHPDWPGWALIDEYKGGGLSLKPGSTTWDVLDHHVIDFYHREFWLRAGCHMASRLSAEVAKELFDTAVNMSPHRAVAFVQRALNLLNRDTHRTFDDLVVDGRYGRRTDSALSNVMRQSAGEHALLVYMNVLQGMYYIELMERIPRLEKYARGWAVRVWYSKGRG